MRATAIVLIVSSSLGVVGCTRATAAPTETILATARDQPSTDEVSPTIASPREAVPTHTPSATATAEPTPTDSESAELQPTASEPPTPIPQAKPLSVEFKDLHYECRKHCEDRGDGAAFWGYRSFQALMVVENRGVKPLRGGRNQETGWAPTRWIITDGVSQRSDDYAWQWVAVAPGSEQDPWLRPDIPPGGSAEWTWMAFPLMFGEWVSAVEYVDEWGNLYRQDFPKPEGGQFNYVDCGDPKEGSC